jgi:hypothetical protein
VGKGIFLVRAARTIVHPYGKISLGLYNPHSNTHTHHTESRWGTDLSVRDKVIQLLRSKIHEFKIKGFF